MICGRTSVGLRSCGMPGNCLISSTCGTSDRSTLRRARDCLASFHANPTSKTKTSRMPEERLRQPEQVDHRRRNTSSPWTNHNQDRDTKQPLSHSSSYPISFYPNLHHLTHPFIILLFHTRPPSNTISLLPHLLPHIALLAGHVRRAVVDSDGAGVGVRGDFCVGGDPWVGAAGGVGGAVALFFWGWVSGEGGRERAREGRGKGVLSACCFMNFSLAPPPPGVLVDIFERGLAVC